MATTPLTKTPTRVTPGLSLWIRWVVANLIGGFLGWGFAIIFSSMTLGIGFALSWVFIGGWLGLMQSYVLLKRSRLFQIDKATWRTSDNFFWIGSTIVGTLISFISVVAIQILLPAQSVTADNTWRDVLGFIVGGILYGVLQWLALRRTAKRTALWIVACALGWGMGVIIGLRIANTIADMFRNPGDTEDVILLGYWDLVGIMAAGTIGILVFGMITGVFLSLLGLGSKDLSGNPDTLRTARNGPDSSQTRSVP